MKRYMDKIVSKNHNIRIEVTNMPRTKGSKNRPESDFDLKTKKAALKSIDKEIARI